MAKEKRSLCCWSGGNKGFPTFAVILLVVGLLWLLTDIGYISSNIPWFPVILIIVAIGWIVDNKNKK